MRGLWKDFLKRACIGFSLGVVVGLMFLSITGVQEYQDEYGSGQLIIYILSSGALGAVNMGATVVYSMEEWGLLKTTLTHFCICIASYCCVGFSLGWLSVHSASTWWMMAGVVAAYAVIWIIMYNKGKREIRDMNQALARWKEAQKDELQVYS